MSAFVRITDSQQTSRDVRNVPTSDIERAGHHLPCALRTTAKMITLYEVMKRHNTSNAIGHASVQCVYTVRGMTKNGPQIHENRLVIATSGFDPEKDIYRAKMIRGNGRNGVPNMRPVSSCGSRPQ